MSLHDIDPVSASPAYDPPPSLALPLDEDTGPVSLHQEINERRARIENAELLRGLRSL